MSVKTTFDKLPTGFSFYFTKNINPNHGFGSENVFIKSGDARYEVRNHEDFAEGAVVTYELHMPERFEVVVDAADQQGPGRAPACEEEAIALLAYLAGKCPPPWSDSWSEGDFEEIQPEALAFVRAASPAVVKSVLSRLSDAEKRASQVAIKQEPVSWSNGCNQSVPRALRYLANHDRPIGGSSQYNSEHLLQLADEIESMAKRPLYDVPPASVSLGKFLGLVEHCKFSDKRIAELTSQLNMVRLYEQKEVWYWQGDGEDHLGSLVCPVVINAEDLRELLARQVLLSDGATLAPDAVQVVSVMKCDGNHGGPRCADSECWNDESADPVAAEWIDGLPQAGVLCEVSMMGGQFNRGSIRFYEDGYCMWRMVDEPLPTYSAYKVEECKFRPILTPEQIAAEERIKAAQEWLKGVEREYGVDVADECENILMAAEAKRVAK